MGAQFSSIFWPFHKEHDDAAENSGIPLSKPRETTSKAGTVRRHALSSTSALHLPLGSAEDPESGQQITKSGWWFGTFCIFHILGIIITTDQIIFFQRGRYTTNQKMFRVSSESWTPATIRTCFAEHSACSAKTKHIGAFSAPGFTTRLSGTFGEHFWTWWNQAFFSLLWHNALLAAMGQCTLAIQVEQFPCHLAAVNPMFNPFRKPTTGRIQNYEKNHAKLGV